MPLPGVHVEVLANPADCRYAQIEAAIHTAELLQRGRFVYCIPPPHDCAERAQDEDSDVCPWCCRRLSED
jgi:hypothetical protein